MTKSLNELNIGDDVVVNVIPYDENNVPRLAKVDKVGKGFVTVEGVNYKITTGMSTGWMNTSISVPTEDEKLLIRGKIHRLRLIHTIRSIDFSVLPTDRLEEIISVVNREQ